MDLVPMDQKQNGGMMEVAVSRQAQEVQAAMVIAQRFPRDTNRAFTRIMEDCKRKGLAEKAVYAYPRGGQTVSGPSIRLAEAVAKAWGNLDFGVIELERKLPMGNLAGESVVMTYCWDLETNTRSQNVFTVRHARDKNVTVDGVKKKIQEQLTDERDIYEMVANYAARRKRANILSVLPADIVDKAVEMCRASLKSSGGPMVDKIRTMILAFKEVGVSQEMIEKKMNHEIDLTTADELVDFQQIYNSIKDGVANRSEFFELTSNSLLSNDSKTPDSQPAEEVQTLGKQKPKNHAPQTSEEAKKLDAEIKQKRAEQPDASQAAEENQVTEAEVSKPSENKPQPTRAELVKELLDLQAAVSYNAVQFKKVIKEQTNKEELKEVTNPELQMVIMRFHAIGKEQREQKGEK